MRATYAGGATWVLTSPGGTTVAVNPALRDSVGTSGLVRYPFAPAREIDLEAFPRLDAVLLTGTRPEQLDLPSLHLCDRRIPVLASPLLPVVHTDAVELLGFVVLRLPLDRDHAVGDLRVRFTAPGATTGVRLPDAGLAVSTEDNEHGFLLHGNGTTGGGAGLEVRPERGVRSSRGHQPHDDADRTPGQTWLVDRHAERTEDAAWVRPAPGGAAPLRARGALHGPFPSDRAGRDAYAELLGLLPELARDLVLHPLAGDVRHGWCHGVADGLGPKSLLLTLLAGPGGTTCQFALDVTRTRFVPAREDLATARTRYPAGLTLHLSDLLAVTRGEVHVEDVAAVAADAWSTTGPSTVVLDRLCDVFGAAARPSAVAAVLQAQVGELLADWAVPHLLGRPAEPAVGYAGVAR